MSQPFAGLFSYPLTPLTQDGEPNLGALARLVRNSLTAGVSGVTVLATSGAGVTFDRGERHAVVEAAVEAAQAGERSIPVYVAVSAVSTREVRNLARDAEQAGANGLLLTPFSYLPLSDSEVRVLFSEIGDATGLPLCFYNKPVQTQYDVAPETLAHLAESTTVVAVKETMRRDNLDARIRQLREAVGDDFSIGLSSDVHLLADLPRVDAWHTGLAALLPVEYVQVWRNARSGHRQGVALDRLQCVALALSETKHALGALHALANSLGVPTAGPRGPFAAATEDEAVRLLNAVNGLPRSPQS